MEIINPSMYQTWPDLLPSLAIYIDKYITFTDILSYQRYLLRFQWDWEVMILASCRTHQSWIQPLALTNWVKFCINSFPQSISAFFVSSHQFKTTKYIQVVEHIYLVPGVLINKWVNNLPCCPEDIRDMYQIELP